MRGCQSDFSGACGREPERTDCWCLETQVPLSDWWPRRSGNPDQAAASPDESALQAAGRGSIFKARDRGALDARRIACACSIVVDGEGNGTGFLIGKDLVLTNYHVVVDAEDELRTPKSIKCRFGYYEVGEHADGEFDWVDLLPTRELAYPAFSRSAPGDVTLSQLHADYVGAGDESLEDYAVLRLQKPVGAASGKGPTGDLDPLGWIEMIPDQPMPRVGQPVLVVEFPVREGAGPHGYRQEAASAAYGFMKSLIPGGARAEHDAATKRGASGGPVFDSSSSLIGLHNAGRVRPDGNAENRFIPIVRILEDIKRRNPALYDEIAASEPPQLKLSGVTPKIREAAKARVKAAKTLLDREYEHGDILEAIGRQSEQPVQVNHVICYKERDQIDFFVGRLRVSAALLENLPIATITSDFLQGQFGKPNSFSPWQLGGITWPYPDTPPDRAKRNFANQLRSQGVLPRTLLTITVEDIDDRLPAKELDYMKALGEALAEYTSKSEALKASRQMLQAVVIYLVPTDIEIDVAPFSPLWQPDAAPQHCGVSVSLRTIGRNDVQPWIALLNSVWSPEEQISLPDSFKRKDKLAMSKVFELLDPAINKIAVAVATKAVGDTK